jgi:hypothetical protein
MSITASRRVNIASIALALAVAVFLTIHLSVAAFTDTTENPGNLFTAGEVIITDDQAGVAVFEETGIVPGWESDPATIVTTNDSTVLTDVGLYVDITADSGLADYLHVTVTRDGDPLYDDALVDLPTSFEDADQDEEAGEGNTRSYVFVVSFPDGQADEDDAQGESATVSFIWEARSQ